VRSVYARLEADGLVRSEQGRGTFVGDEAAIDERLGAVARRALAESLRAGLNPRDVAALLFAAPTPAAAPAPADPAGRRVALRAEITALERELADVRFARALQESAPTAERGAGARLLGEDDLRAQRDALAARLTAMREPDDDDPPAAAGASAVSATRPGVAWRLVPRPA
jgi:hypothetical protein